MPQKGTFTALQRLQPIGINWGEVAKSGVEREDYLYNRRKKEEEVRQKKRDALDYDVLEPVITGIDSLDKGLTLGIQEASLMQHGDYKAALKDPNYADSPEYKIRAKNLNNYSKNAKALSDGFSELAQKAIAKSNDGTLSAWDDDLLSTLNGGFVSEKVKFGVSPDGGVTAYVASTDPNQVTDENPDGYIYDEDGKIKMTKVTPNEVFKGLGKFSLTPDVDIQKTATDIGTELGKSISSSIDGYTITEEQSWEKKREDTRKIVRGLLGSPKNPTALAKRLWADEMGESSRNLNEDDMSKIEDLMLDKIKPFYDEEVKKTKNYAALESARGRAEKRSKEKVTPVVVPDSTTGKPKKVKVPNQNTEGYAISFGSDTSLVSRKTDSSTEFVKNLYYTDKGIFADKIKGFKSIGDPIKNEDGSVDILESIRQGKGWRQEIQDGVRISEKELTNIAKNKNVTKPDGSPFRDGKELIDFLKEQYKKMGGKEKSTSPGDLIFKQ